MNCFHNKRDYWFEKPVTRCPYCKNPLRQNTQKKRWKEKIRSQILVNGKKERRKNQLKRSKAKWKRKQYRLKKFSILSDIKNRRKTDPVFLEHERQINKNWKLKNKEKISSYNKQYNIKNRHKKLLREKQRRDRIKLESKITMGISVLFV